MATDIIMPNLGFDTQSARLIEWLKQPGDRVQKGEILAVIESDKANVELESIAAGVLLEQRVAAGAEADVGAVIARIGQAAEMTPAHSTPETANPTPAATQAVDVSPLARKLAEENNVNLATVQGSGPRGRITKEDIETILASRPTSPPLIGGRVGEGVSVLPAMRGGGRVLALPKVRKAAREAGVNLTDVQATGLNGVTTLADLQTYIQAKTPVVTPAAPPEVKPAPQAPAREGVQVIPLSRVRQVIGKRLGESKREAPHFYVTGEFDLEAALKRLNSLPEPRPGINDLIQYVSVQTLRRVPALNATFEGETLYQYDAINLAIAVARDEGLLTPVLHGAERFSLQGMAQEGRKLIERARANRLQPDDLQGGTFTISNLGVIRQVDQFVAIINPPQVAILAVGAVKPRPVVIDGGMHIRHTVHLTLSGDHRAVDGVHLGKFMVAFQTELDNFSQGQ